VAAGVRHSVILKDNGSVWTAGYNFNGQLGLGNQDDSVEFTQVSDLGGDVLSVAAGNYHTAILKKDGTVWTAGENYYGQLGTSDPSDRRRFFQVKDSSGNPLTGAKAIAARGDLTLILKEGNSLLWAGNYLDPAPRDENNLPPEKPAEEEKSTLTALVPGGAEASSFGEIQKIGLGFQSVYIISSGGRLWAAGSNRYGQLSLDYDTGVLHNLRIVYPRSE
jgi:alpha-tubulin suppressor-like RCC1 family protein